MTRIAVVAVTPLLSLAYLVAAPPRRPWHFALRVRDDTRDLAVLERWQSRE